MGPNRTLAIDDVAVSTAGGAIRPRDVAAAREAVRHAAAHAHEPILAARVRLIHHRDPALERPYSAQANVDVNGRSVRAHAAATSLRDAIDELDQRLRSQLARLGRYRANRPPSDSVATRRYRVGQSRASAIEHHPRVVRHKSYELPLATIDDAIWDMDLMDYGFHLFKEAETGQDSVLYRAELNGYRLAQVEPRAGWQPDSKTPVTVSPRSAARLTLPEAIEHLDATALPFLFYAVATGRGRVVYRRHDGDYGVIMPPD